MPAIVMPRKTSSETKRCGWSGIGLSTDYADSTDLEKTSHTIILAPYYPRSVRSEIFIVQSIKGTSSSVRSEMYVAHKWAGEFEWYSWTINISCLRHEDVRP